MNESKQHSRAFWIRPLAAVAGTRPVIAVLKRTIPGFHRWLMQRSKGKLVINAGLPTLLLTTTGRKSRQARTAPLLYVEYDGRWVIIGTNFGGASHPGWYFNLKANPKAELLVEGEQVEVLARDARPDERSALWAGAVEIYPGYETYKSRIGDRQVPIVVLERRAEGTVNP